ncbi:hypothetical protein DS2_09842 [Catenovulum agarivorans DS-2]|uniref:Uncharacterized protein n=1 Tax=Catenovulum agarivorans DS-2 TaxID=1328313 RepID=W7QXT1_9ALTE|nr:hypothetical protein [Catenovulum agarivorans]EWH10085.1 hypothetical protein DS2_09842 [Catenovulum agarivorans DS-2]
MARILQKNSERLVVTAFPKCISLIAIAFLLLFWGAALFGDKDLKVEDYVIFNGVCLVVLAIQRSRKTIFDKHNKTVVLHSRFLWIKSENWFSLKDVRGVEMVYGKGGRYARGGAVYLLVKDQRKAIVDSDICFGNAERNVGIKQQIAEWLEL